MDLSDLEERCDRAIAATAKVFKSKNFDSKGHVKRMMRRVLEKYYSLKV